MHTKQSGTGGIEGLYCERSGSGGVEGLGMRLGVAVHITINNEDTSSPSQLQ